jgi:hypothetical protein
MVGPDDMLIVTLELLVQPLLLMVQVNTYVPGVSDVMVVVGDVGLVMMAKGPLTWLQVPMPMAGVLAAMVMLLPQRVWAGPALEGVTFCTFRGSLALVVPHSLVTATDMV